LSNTRYSGSSHPLRWICAVLITLPACGSEIPEFSDNAWVTGADSCPVDVMPALSVPLSSMESHCSERPEVCWKSCWTGSGEDCYHLALAEQREDIMSSRSETLFLMSCKRGINSGCTNRAAGMYRAARADEDGESDRLRCANRTFEEVCDRGDPWACTMFGFSLTRGIGVPVDYRLALKVLPGACALDPDDEACQTANAIAEEASNALGHTDDPLPQP